MSNCFIILQNDRQLVGFWGRKTKKVNAVFWVALMFSSSLLTIRAPAQLIAFTVITDKIAFTFTAEIDKLEQLLAENRSDEIRSMLMLTAEQIAALKHSDTVKVFQGHCLIAADQSYGEVVTYYWFGGYCHIHLCAMDAVDLKSASKVTEIMATAISALLFVAGVAYGIVATVTTALLLVEIESWNLIYDTDQNTDQSFDLWYDVTPWTVFFWWLGFMQIETPHFVWFVSMLTGAQVVKDKRQPQYPLGTFCWGSWRNFFR